MNSSTALQLIRKRFGKYKKSGPEVQVNCPYCILRRPSHTADKEFKLYINIDKQVYQCFRCEVKGRLSNLFPQLEAVSIAVNKVIEKTESDDNKLESLPIGKKLSELIYPWKDLVFDFLHTKHFTPYELEKRHIYFCENYKKGDYEFGPSIIFPIYQFGSYRGFQSRTIYKNTTPKYIGASNMDRRSILYNYDVAFNQKDYLVITEGFFDCIRVGDHAIATLGKSITENQLRLIRLGDFKSVMVFLDKDAEAEARVIAKKLAIYFKTYLAVPTAKDPGDMDRFSIMELLSGNLERIY